MSDKPDALHSTKEVRAHYAEIAATYEEKANRTCKQTYAKLVRRTLGRAQKILEVGAGSSSLLEVSDARFKVACDLSVPMLTARHETLAGWPLAADAQAMPCRDASFDAVFCINVLEHTPDPQRVVSEAARLLEPGGRFLAVTPNGDVEWLLDILELLHLKLPEGPHRFQTFSGLADLAGDAFDIIEQRRLLSFPAGPMPLVRFIDRLAPCKNGWGLFLYILLEKK